MFPHPIFLIVSPLIVNSVYALSINVTSTARSAAGQHGIGCQLTSTSVHPSHPSMSYKIKRTHTLAVVLINPSKAQTTTHSFIHSLIHWKCPLKLWQVKTLSLGPQENVISVTCRIPPLGWVTSHSAHQYDAHWHYRQQLYTTRTQSTQVDGCSPTPCRSPRISDKSTNAGVTAVSINIAELIDWLTAHQPYASLTRIRSNIGICCIAIGLTICW